MSVAFLRHRVSPRYPVRSDWAAFTPWELVDGRYQRLYRSRSNRGRVRKAVVERAHGGWRWRVTETGVAGSVKVVGNSSGGTVYTMHYNAFQPAEVSAATK